MTESIRLARQTEPGYAAGRPVGSREISRLLARHRVEVLRADLVDVPVLAWPAIDGVVRVFIDHREGPAISRYAKLHELGHVLAGDLSEPIAFNFTGPLPEAEPVADLFALLGILDEAETDQGPEYVEELVRERVPLDDRGWQQHRIPWLAPEVCRIRELVKS